MIEYNSIQKQSSSNIAIIKYWGKHGDQLPNNPSLSLTLKNAFTTTSMHYMPAEKMQLEYYFEGIRNNVFEEKIFRFLQKVTVYLPFLANYSLRFDSENSFPHSTGIASSASSMAAIAQCLVAMEAEVTRVLLSYDEMLKKASFIARLGSGSASRSVYDGWVSWGKTDLIPASSDEFATQITFSLHPIFVQLCDAILIVSSKSKKVSSTLGHQLMNTHPFAQSRYLQAETNLEQLIHAMQTGAFDLFTLVAENEALTLHSLLMTSSADGLLLKPATLSIIEAIRDFRKSTGSSVCFTLDAGPNVHLLYPTSERERVLPFIHQVLLPFCEEGHWIDD